MPNTKPQSKTPRSHFFRYVLFYFREKSDFLLFISCNHLFISSFCLSYVREIVQFHLTCFSWPNEDSFSYLRILHLYGLIFCHLIFRSHTSLHLRSSWFSHILFQISILPFLRSQLPFPLCYIYPFACGKRSCMEERQYSFS